MHLCFIWQHHCIQFASSITNVPSLRRVLLGSRTQRDLALPTNGSSHLTLIKSMVRALSQKEPAIGSSHPNTTEASGKRGLPEISISKGLGPKLPGSCKLDPQAAGRQPDLHVASPLPALHPEAPAFVIRPQDPTSSLARPQFMASRAALRSPALSSSLELVPRTV